MCITYLSFELGYSGALYGSEEDYLKPQSSKGFYDISCPNEYFSTYSCNYSFVANNSNGCDANGGPALVTCVNIGSPPPEPSCSSTQLTDVGTGRYFNGTIFSVGRPEICVNNTYLPVCGNVTQEEAILLCYDSLYRYGALTYPTFGSSISDYLSNDEANTITTDLQCPSDLFYDFNFGNCNPNAVNSEESCSSYQPQPAITCYNAPKPCEEASVTTHYVSSQYKDGVFTYFYVVRYCQSNEYSTLCRNGITDEEAKSICLESRGRPNGYIADNYMNHTHYLSTDKSLVNFNCNGGTLSAESCSFNVVDSCSNYNGHAVIACNKDDSTPDDCDVDGNVRLFNKYNVSVDSAQIVGGIVEICLNGKYASVCGNNSYSSVDNDELASLACSALGYSIVTEAIKVEPSLSSTSHVINSLSCPLSAYDFTPCSFDTTSSGMCSIHQYDVKIQCNTSSVPVDKPDCFDGKVRIGNITTISNLKEEISGILEICVNKAYQQVCGSKSANLNASMLAQQACEDIGYTTDTSSSYTLTYPSSLTIIDSASCPETISSLIQCNFTITSFGSCIDTNTFNSINITCGKTKAVNISKTVAYCNESGTYRLYNSISSYTTDGLLRVSGIPQGCRYGVWSSGCTIKSIGSNLPTLLCQELGYQGGSQIPFNDEVYGSSPAGTLYTTNITCTNSLAFCTLEETSADECLSGGLEYIIQCYNIMTSPAITQLPIANTVLANTKTNFTCLFTGDPSPLDVQWVLVRPSSTDSVSVVPSETVAISTATTGDNAVVSTLTISSVTVMDAGVYSCIASNGAPFPASGSATLAVIVSPTMQLKNTSSVSLTEDESFTLTCTESGALPDLPIIWTKGTQSIVSSSRIAITTSEPTQDSLTGLFSVESVLTISSVAVIDSGDYTCRTTSLPPYIPQPIVSATIALDVQVRNECTLEAPNNLPSPCVNGYCIDGVKKYFCQCDNGFTGTNCDQQVTTPSPPTFVIQPSKESLLLGDVANFSCLVTGDPKPKIAWLKDGAIIPGEISPFLVIFGVEALNRGFYACSASNSEGTITSDQALLRLQNVAQYVSQVTLASASRRKRQLPPLFENIQNQARELAIGMEIAPDAIIVGLDLFTIPLQVVYTVRTPVANGRPNTTGVMNGLDEFGVEINETFNTTFSVSSVTRFDGCLANSTQLMSSSVRINWPEIGAGENATIPCPCGSISDATGLTASRMCQSNFPYISQWLESYTAQCQYDKSSLLLCQAAASNDSAESATLLSSTTYLAGNTFNEDNLRIATALLSDLANNPDISSEVAYRLLESIDFMQNVPPSTLRSAMNSTNMILESIESVTGNIPLTGNGDVTVIKPSIAIMAKKIVPATFTGLTFTIVTRKDGTLDDDSLSASNDRQTTASVNVPNNFLNGIPNAARVGFGVHINDLFFMQTENKMSQTPQSVICSLDVYSDDGKVEVSGLNPPIEFTFKLHNDGAGNISSLCVFWDPLSSSWSTDGCSTNISESNVTCRCSHLSSFTIVESEESATVTPSSPTESLTIARYEAELIMVIGAGVSVLIVFVTAFSHIISANQRSSDEGKIIACSHLSLVVLYIVFIVATLASKYVDSKIFCGIFSGLFHYMSIVYVMWIFTESLYYVVRLKKKGRKSTYVYLVMLIVSFVIVPLTVIIGSAGAAHEYYIFDNSFCRPQGYLFYYGYIIPITVIFAAAVICIIISFIIASCVPMADRRQTITPHLFALTILLPIVFITWVFGLVGTDYHVRGLASTATQYIFGFMMVIHAIVLLVLTMLRTEDTRNTWLFVCNRLTGRSDKYSVTKPMEEVVSQKKTQISNGNTSTSTEGTIELEIVDKRDHL